MNRTTRRFWLSFNPAIQFQPLTLVYEFSRKFDLIFNIRNSCLGHDLGIIGIEVEGKSNTIGEAVDWLESVGVVVEPVELSVIEG